MGAQRRQHHKRVEAERAAGIEATRIRMEQEAAQRAYDAQIQAMREQAQALTPDRAPQPIQSTLSAANVGVRTARSARGTTTGLARGISQLRIPLNLGGSSGSGLNIG